MFSKLIQKRNLYGKRGVRGFDFDTSVVKRILVLQILQPYTATHDAGAKLQIIDDRNTLRTDRNLYGQWHFGCRYVVFQRILN